MKPDHDTESTAAESTAAESTAGLGAGGPAGSLKADAVPDILET